MKYILAVLIAGSLFSCKQSPDNTAVSFSDMNLQVRHVLPENNITIDTIAVDSDAEVFSYNGDTIVTQSIFLSAFEAPDTTQPPAIYFKDKKWPVPPEIAGLNLEHLLHIKTSENKYLVFIWSPKNCNGSFCSVTEVVIINTSGGSTIVNNRYATPAYLLDYDKDGELDILLMKPRRQDTYERFTMYLATVKENSETVNYLKNEKGDILKFSFEMDSALQYHITYPLNK